MESPFIFQSEVKTQESILESVEASKGGKVGIPDRILTKNLLISSDKLDDFVKEWRKKYDFHLAEFQLDINPNPKYDPEWVCITCSLNPWEPTLVRPIAKDLFPSTKFVDKNWKVTGNFGVSASLGFDKLPDFLQKFDGKINGEAKVEFTYAPKVARVDSGTSGSNFHWNFRKASGEAPLGGLDLKAVILRSRAVIEPIQALFEIAVKFDRLKLPWGDDMARATAESLIEFNAGPI